MQSSLSESSHSPDKRRVFLTGASGYLGRRLARELSQRGHSVRALCRPGSVHKLPRNVAVVVGEALDAESYRAEVESCDTFVHLVGVAHPSPSKAAQFRSVDLASAKQALAAAGSAGVRHFVYVSVAQPAPVMRAYIDARREAEAAIRARGIDCTVLRPFYVLGPNHYWPILLLPLYWVSAFIPAFRDTAARLGLVTLGSMLRAMVFAIEHPRAGFSIVEVPEIKRF